MFIGHFFGCKFILYLFGVLGFAISVLIIWQIAIYDTRTRIREYLFYKTYGKDNK
jgi:hypothetical protein